MREVKLAEIECMKLRHNTRLMITDKRRGKMRITDKYRDNNRPIPPTREEGVRNKITIITGLERTAHDPAYSFKLSRQGAPPGYKQCCDVCSKRIDQGSIHVKGGFENSQSSSSYDWHSCLKCTPGCIKSYLFLLLLAWLTGKAMWLPPAVHLH